MMKHVVLGLVMKLKNVYYLVHTSLPLGKYTYIILIDLSIKSFYFLEHMKLYFYQHNVQED